MLIDGTTRLYGVLGRPIHHSLSPQIHNTWMARHHIPAVYVPLTADDGRQAIHSAHTLGFGGLNITLPFKADAASLCTTLSPLAARLGVVNTLHFTNDTIFGENTDGYGFIQGLQTLAPPLDKVVILGAGGAVPAVLAALAEHTEQPQAITIVNRDTGKARAMTNRLRVNADITSWDTIEQAFDGATLIINAVPFGIHANVPDLPWHLCHPAARAYDLTYNRAEPTPFCQQAAAHGFACIDGLPMLVGQAAAAFALWFGIMPDSTPLLDRQPCTSSA